MKSLHSRMSIKRRNPMRPIARSMLASLAAFLAVAAHAKEFRSADVHPLDYPTVLAVGYMGKLISERTGGRHGIKVYGNSVLGSEKDTIEQGRIGALGLIRINGAPMTHARPHTRAASRGGAVLFAYRAFGRAGDHAVLEESLGHAHPR